MISSKISTELLLKSCFSPIGQQYQLTLSYSTQMTMSTRTLINVFVLLFYTKQVEITGFFLIYFCLFCFYVLFSFLIYSIYVKYFQSAMINHGVESTLLFVFDTNFNNEYSARNSHFKCARFESRRNCSYDNLRSI